jgi:hypothetical protein
VRTACAGGGGAADPGLADRLAPLGVLPVATAVLRATAWDLVSEPLRAALAAAEYQGAAYMARWLDAATGVVRLLEGLGLAPVVVKGAPLAQHLFGHHRRRPTGDLDLLVPVEAVAPAVEALTGVGYRLRAPTHLPALRPGQHAVTLDPTGGGLAPEVDLHWAFTEAWVSRLPDGWMGHIGTTVVEGRTFRAPDALLGTLAAALHLAAHGYELRHALDLAGWDRQLTPAERDALTAFAAEAGAEGHVLRGLELVRELWGDPDPHAGPPLPGASERAHARGALLRTLGVTRTSVLRASPLRRPYVRVALRGLGADRRAAALAGMAGQALWPAAEYLRWRYGGAGLAVRLSRPLRALLGLGRDLGGG